MTAQRKRTNDCDTCDIASHTNCINCEVTDEENDLLGNGFDESAELEDEE